jgi:hypothetical protein
MDGLGGVDETFILERIMEWLIGSVLILIASTSTIAGLAITAVIFLVLVEGLILLQQSIAKPRTAALAHARDAHRQT